MKINTGIYKIENKINHKVYIGQTNNLEKREIQHFSSLRNNNHFNSYLQNSFNKYGEENFTFTVLQLCETREELNYFETYWWEHFVKMVGKNNVYNLAHTGDAKNTSEETRKKNSLSHKGKTPLNKGKKASQETIEKLRISHLGQKSWNKGKHPSSEETKRKISEASKGRNPWNKGIPMSEEQKKKLSLAKKGQKYGKMTEEHKQNLIISLKQAWEKRKLEKEKKEI